MNWLTRDVQECIGRNDTVLDLGCGIMNVTEDLSCKALLGVDIWKPYLEIAKKHWPVLHIEIAKLDFFLDKSFDVILALDFIEHLKLNQAKRVIEEMQRMARKYVIIYTPSIYRTNDENTANVWELGPCAYQKHQCLISADELIRYKFTIDYKVDRNMFAVWKR